MLENSAEVWKEVNLGMLREEMQFRVEPPVHKPTYLFVQKESRQETATKNKDASNNNNDPKAERLAQLDKELATQKAEEDKWTDLSRKLEKKTKQAADNVVRLTTSLKVFRDELAKRSHRVTDVQQQLVVRQERAQAQMDKLQKDLQLQKDQAQKSLEVATKAKGVLEDKADDKESIESKLKAAYRRLKPLEEKVQDLEVNLYGNNSLSGNQREYLKAEVQVERGHRDRVRTQISELEQELEGVAKECTSLTAKQSLFGDEHQRRTLRAESMETQVAEQQEFFKAQLEKFEQEVEQVRKDRDAWETKTLNLAESLEEKRIESAKLDVKLKLFKEQLTNVQAAVKRLNAMKQAVLDSGKDQQEDSDGSESSGSDRDEPEEKRTVVVQKPFETQKYVWQPPGTVKATTLTPAVVAPPAVVKPVKSVPAIPAVIKPVAPKPIVTPSLPVVRVNHVSVKLDKPLVEKPVAATTRSFQEPIKPTYTPSSPISTGSKESSSLAATLEALQRDMQHQKRFQQEHALKMEKQYTQLASKVEGMSSFGGYDAGNKKTSGYDAMESQLSALKLQVQKDAMRDAHDMRQLLQQMNQQCVHLATKLDGLTQEVKARDAQNAKLEEKLQEKESQYYEQMEFLRGEMQRQLERQQQVFTDKVSSAMIQMERVVAAHGTSSHGTHNAAMDNSMASLDSLPPIGDTQAATTTGYSMTSGIKVFGGPLFQK